MQRRRRSKPHTFEERIAEEKARLEALAATLKPGPQKDGLLKKIELLETASDINKWLSSTDLQRPKGVGLFNS